MNGIYLLIAVVAEVGATSALKASEGFSRLVPSLATVAGDAAAFVFLALTSRTIPMGVAYAVWSGVGIVLTVAGVVVINAFSDAARH